MDACYYVLDATGEKYLYTVQEHSPERVAAFRKHAAWWKGHAHSKAYRDKVPPMRWPAFPVRVVVELIER